MLLPVLLMSVALQEKRRRSVPYRLWFKQPPAHRTASRRSIWVHALSVGEVLSAVPLTQSLRQHYPNKPLVFTASTWTGYQIAQQQLQAVDVEVLFFPYDYLGAVKRAVAYVDPEWVMLIETDLWPNFISELNKRGVPVFLANARLSQKTVRGYRRFSFFFMPMLESLSKICVQSQTDLMRYRALGLPSQKVVMTGNLKFDQAVPSFDDVEKTATMKSLGFSPEHPVIVAGSTHEGEEKIWLSVLGVISGSHGTLQLVLAPRDPKRAPSVRRLSRTMGYRAELLSSVSVLHHKPSYDVLVVDQMGHLRRLYAIGDITYVGGSLVACSGHNPLEPAAFGKPVLFGPDMRDFIDISKLLITKQAALKVADARSLEAAVTRLLSDPGKAAAMGRAAREAFDAHAGAVHRIIAIIENELKQVLPKGDGKAP